MLSILIENPGPDSRLYYFNYPYFCCTMDEYHPSCESRKDRPLKKRLGAPDTFPQDEKQVEVKHNITGIEVSFCLFWFVFISLKYC